MVRRRRATLRADRAGATALEFALATPVFLGVLMLAMEIAWQVAIGAALDHSVRSAARWAATGQAVPGGGSRAAEVARIIVTRSGMPIQADRLTVTTESFSSLGGLNSGSGATPGPGGPDALVRYRVTYQSPSLTPYASFVAVGNLTRHTMSFVVRNEPYVPQP